MVVGRSDDDRWSALDETKPTGGGGRGVGSAIQNIVIKGRCVCVMDPQQGVWTYRCQPQRKSIAGLPCLCLLSLFSFVLSRLFSFSFHLFLFT